MMNWASANTPARAMKPLKIGKLSWKDAIFPLVLIMVCVGFAIWSIGFPVDKMVGGYMKADKVLLLLAEHLYVVFISAGAAILVAVPLGILLTRPMFRKIRPAVVGFVSICQTIPSFAVIALMVSVLGIGKLTAIFALWIYSLLPILNNTIAGINSLDPAVIDSARGMGMTKTRILLKIEVPLAFPVIMAGIRTAVVINVATATIAAYVGGGGLGDLIIGGKNANRVQIWGLGALFAASIALLLDHLLGLVEKVLKD